MIACNKYKSAGIEVNQLEFFIFFVHFGPIKILSFMIRKRMPAFSWLQRPSREKHNALPATSSIRTLRPPPAVLDVKLPRFGPIYGNDEEAIRIAKDSALKHILNQDDNPDDYLSSIVKIQTEAMDTYKTNGVHTLKPGSEFQDMMMKDGCFFLQLVLHILGGGPYLGYSDQHPYFGKDIDSSYMIPAMFFLGNQIPYVVIRALMRQRFFQNVIHSGEWSPPLELAKLVLYRTVVEPELKVSSLPSPRSDVLHTLHCLLLGPGNNDPVYSEMKEFPDLEAAGDDKHIKFPSAGELLKLGVTPIKANKGITNIRFQNLVIRAYLHVPPLTIDSDTEHVLRSAVTYEKKLSESDREVTAYCKFIRDLAPTYKDFKILEGSGIIEVRDKNFKKAMLFTLNEIVSSDRCIFTVNFRDIRRKITDYQKPPWRVISFLLGLLAVVNTTFAILSYFNHSKK